MVEICFKIDLLSEQQITCRLVQNKANLKVKLSTEEKSMTHLDYTLFKTRPTMPKFILFRL